MGKSEKLISLSSSHLRTHCLSLPHSLTLPPSLSLLPISHVFPLVIASLQLELAGVAGVRAHLEYAQTLNAEMRQQVCVCVCVCVSMYENERVCECIDVRKEVNEWCVFLCFCVCVCVCVCVRMCEDESESL